MRRLSEPDVIKDAWIRRDVSLAPLTTFGIGGRARTLAAPRNEDELIEAVRRFAGEGAFYIIGGGSNVLVCDEPIDAPVILTTALNAVTVDEGEDEIYVHCASGSVLKDIVALSARRGWTGLEFSAGIPGTVGGAIAGNSGAAGGAMDSVTASLRTVETEGTVREWKGRDIEWGYRSCGPLMDSARGVLGATLRLARSTPDAVAEKVRDAMRMRRSQPLSSRTAGCVFKNPPGDSAGRLLEACGCKGMSVGGVRVSELHANFFENTGGASADEVLRLAGECRRRVRDAFGVWLSFEIKILGAAGESVYEGGQAKTA
jgi:UDP-N-acetylmuramate dehydrogenase